MACSPTVSALKTVISNFSGHCLRTLWLAVVTLENFMKFSQDSVMETDKLVTTMLSKKLKAHFL
jgi:hypothetical protein